MKRLVPVLLLVLGSSVYAQDQQVGARTKAMGGSYTAFEDDPISVWLNPAGIATQADGMSLAYQTAQLYELSITKTGGNIPSAEPGMPDPPIVPSYAGFVFQLGSEENPHAVGLCFATPFRLKLGYFNFNAEIGPQSPPPAPPLKAQFGLLGVLDQTFYRMRAAYAHDLRFRPVGATGLLTHISLGLGADLSVTSEDYRELAEDADDRPISVKFTDTGVGAGAGLLCGLYESSSFKVNLGAAWQTKVNYQFSVSQEIAPLFDWPNQVNAGATFYMLEGLPLRVTLDAQWIDWDGASSDSALPAGYPGQDHFRAIVNYSAGVEYKLKVAQNMSVLPRAGVRRAQAPWHDKNNLPGIGPSILVIDTHSDRYWVGSGGLGLSWSTEKGDARSVDLGFDYGGDAPSFALSFTMGF